MNRQLPRAGLAATLAAALALVATAELVAGAPGPAPLAPAGPPPPAPAVAASPDPGGWADTILARPLFRTDRRPLAAAAAATVPAAPPPRLSAIVVTATGRGAVFAGGDGSPVAVAPGGEIGGYRVGAITPDSVRLLGPDGPVTVHPTYADGGAADPAAPPVTSPPPPGTRPPARSARFPDGPL